MPLVTMKTNIEIEAQHLDSQIKDHMWRKLLDVTRDSCTVDNGYIIDVARIVDYDHYIDKTTSRIMFAIRFEANTLKPEPGLVFTGTVCMCFQDGIFLLVDPVKVLIARTDLPEYTYDELDHSYTKGAATIKIGDVIDVEITATMFVDKNIKCFGTIV